MNNIFGMILEESLDNKLFMSIGDLKNTIKNILNKHSKITLKDDASEFKKFGYSFKTYKREFRIKIIGDDAHSLISELKKENINCKYSSISDIISIRYEDNVAISGLLSQDAQNEIENSTFGLIGYITKDKNDPQFFEDQQIIYDELIKNKLIEWEFDGKMFKLKLK